MIYLDEGCYRTFKSKEGYLEHFGLVFSEFQKNNAKICTQHRTDMREYCNMFQNNIRKRTKFTTFKEKKAVQKLLYPIFLNILCDKSKNYDCLEGTEFFLALLPDWREKLKTPRKNCYDSNEHIHKYHALEIYLNKKKPCKKI